MTKFLNKNIDLSSKENASIILIKQILKKMPFPMTCILLGKGDNVLY